MRKITIEEKWRRSQPAIVCFGIGPFSHAVAQKGPLAFSERGQSDLEGRSQ
jgi:hypothetical protein